MSHTPNLFAMKLVVISLGLVLIGGTIFVFGAIAHKARNELGAAACRDATIHLKDKGTITGITPQGNLVQVTVSANGENKVLTVDRCKGTIQQTLTIAP